MIERILKALEYRTLPQFVYKLKGEDFFRNYEADIVYIGFENPKRWVQQINQNAEVPLELTDEEIFTYYLLSNQQLKGFIQSGQRPEVASLAFGLNEEESRIFEDLFFKIYQDQRELAALVFDINAEREMFQQRAQKQKAEIDIFQESKPWAIGNFQQSSKNLVFTLTINNTLLGLFDFLVPNETFPLISTDRYYKSTVGYSGVIERPEEPNTILFLYAIPNSSSRADIILKSIVSDPTSPQFSLTVPEDFEAIGSIFSDFVGAVSFELSKRVVNGSFGIYPLRSKESPWRFNRIVWSDIVMNTLVSEDFFIDESIRATKQASVVHMKFIQGDKKINFALSENSLYDVQDQKTVFYIRARVNNIDEGGDGIEDLKNRLGRALGFYQEVAPQIAADYNEYLTDKIVLQVGPGTTRARLRQIDPEMFLEGYSRMCQASPRIVGEEDALRIVDQGFQVMRFPRDDPNARIFACNEPRSEVKKDYIYPGLRENRLSNKDKYPVLPCCFKEDQRAKKNSLYLQYYEGARKQVSRFHMRFLLTSKRVKNGQTGKIPEYLNEYFSLLSSKASSFSRRGVPWSASSIVDCILEVVSESHRKKSERGRIAECVRVRSVLSNIPIVCRQETWNLSLAAVEKMLADSKQFLDASMFLSLLETFFSCRIVILTADGFKQPNHSNGYLRFEKPLSWPVIVVYENLGGEAEKVDYPQYEIMTGIEEISEAIYRDYIGSLTTFRVVKGVATQVDWEDEKEDLEVEEIQSQLIDQYGKVYGVNIIAKGMNKTFVFNQRLPPLPDIPQSYDIYYDDTSRAAIINVLKFGAFSGRTVYNSSYGSRMQQFLQAREQVKLLLENSKYMLSKKGEVKYQVVERPELLYKFDWASSTSLEVPHRKVGEGLIANARAFRDNHPADFRKYKDLQYIPLSYKSILDFQKLSDIVLGEVGEPAVANIRFELEEDSDEPSFFLRIRNSVFLCKRLKESLDENIPTSLYISKTREIIEPIGSKRKVFLSETGASFEMFAVA
jgi:hypothetical protein